MTTVTVFRSPDGALSGFDCRGHADYADAGEDIVCAAVSALTQANAQRPYQRACRRRWAYQIDEKDGVSHRLHWRNVPESKRAGAQLLLETLVSALQMMRGGLCPALSG